jgi:hypothetical protein
MELPDGVPRAGRLSNSQGGDEMGPFAMILTGLVWLAIIFQSAFQFG